MPAHTKDFQEIWYDSFFIPGFPLVLELGWEPYVQAASQEDRHMNSEHVYKKPERLGTLDSEADKLMVVSKANSLWLFSIAAYPP